MVRDTNTAVNKLASKPNVSVTAKPLIGPVPKRNRMPAETMVVTWVSTMVIHAWPNPCCTAAAAAVQQGFGHAWITIVDTHVTTIVSAGILFLFGTGPIKGFAVTLTFGLLANLFTAVFVSRTIFDAILERKSRGAELSV